MKGFLQYIYIHISIGLRTMTINFRIFTLHTLLPAMSVLQNIACRRYIISYYLLLSLSKLIFHSLFISYAVSSLSQVTRLRSSGYWDCYPHYCEDGWHWERSNTRTRLVQWFVNYFVTNSACYRFSIESFHNFM